MNIQNIIAQLEYYVAKQEFNVRLVHKIKAISSVLGEDVRTEILAIVTRFDEAADAGDFAPAMLAMERMLGLLEGIIEAQHVRADSELGDSLIPIFKLSSSDKVRVLELCAEMRRIILSTDTFDHPHKIRLANRVAAIEAEVHKEKGKFDVILGGVIDVGETLGKFGESIKPLTDRMAEIRRLAQKSTSDYEQIPPPDEVKKITDQREGEGSD